MVDYFNSIIRNLSSKKLEANPLLIFEQRNVSTEGVMFPTLNNKKEHLKDKNGKLLYKAPYKRANFKGLEFKIYESGLITLSGSLHKYWNDGVHNYNDFNLEAFSWVLNDLKTKFEIDTEHCILKCLEIGINIKPPIRTNDILENCLLHKTHPFEWQKNSDEGKYKQVKHSQYIIKIYNKALHYISKGFEILTEIMRFEIKYTKMEKLNKVGVFTLKDLENYGLHNFKNELLKEWQNVLFYDNTTRIDTLCSESKKETFLRYSNPNYWTGLLSNNQKENFKYHRGELKKFITKNSNNIKELTSEIMRKKIDFLNSNTTLNDILTIPSIQVVGNDEVKKPILSYQEQKKAIEEYNRLAVLNYNSRGNYKLQ